MTTSKPPTRWRPGQSGNPNGRPKGKKNRATILAAALVSEQAQAIAQRVIDAALAGDLSACKFLLERLLPRERLLSFDLPDETTSPEGIKKAQDAIFEGVAIGSITPSEGNALSAILESRRRAIETVELADRVARLEEAER